MPGPLNGIKIVELAGVGPAPYGCMLLADAGAEILCIERPGGALTATPAPLRIEQRSRSSVGVNLKEPSGVELVRDLAAKADAFIEPYRPGVAERLGLGPDELLARNPALVYGRMTGWGQDGHLAERAGHDIDYAALSGALWGMGRAEEVPAPPLNLVADFGGGGMLLAFGMTAALLEAKTSGQGQVVDAAMIDGVASMMHFVYGMRAAGVWSSERGSNLLDSGAPFYEVYETSDGGYMAAGAVEPQFYALLLDGLGLDPSSLPSQFDKRSWPEVKARFKAIFASRTRSAWEEIFDGSDACVFPVLSIDEAPRHPVLTERGVYVDDGGLIQPAPVPRFSRTQATISKAPSVPGADTSSSLVAWGIDEARIDELLDHGALFDDR
jgi:alpha-methylacyl-CoA racemase